MKLGICYNVFEGEELLEYAINSIRSEINFISVIYQTTSYFGNNADPLPYLKDNKSIDFLQEYIPNFSLTPKENELNIRNLGLKLSIEAGCTHHISADVDEFYIKDQLKYVKNNIGDADCSVVYLENYYKDPTYLIRPFQGHLVSFIHPVTTNYSKTVDFPFRIEITRKCDPCNNYKLFTKEEFVIHHMSYVRKDIHKKLNNSSNGNYYNLDKFVKEFDKYKLGDRLRITPDFMNRKTILVDNIFGIKGI